MSWQENTKEILINLKETRMVKDGEDWHGLQTKHLKNLRLFFEMSEMCHSSFKNNASSIFGPISSCAGRTLKSAQEATMSCFVVNPQERFQKSGIFSQLSRNKRKKLLGPAPGSVRQFSVSDLAVNCWQTERRHQFRLIQNVTIKTSN